MQFQQEWTLSKISKLCCYSEKVNEALYQFLFELIFGDGVKKTDTIVL